MDEVKGLECSFVDKVAPLGGALKRVATILPHRSQHPEGPPARLICEYCSVSQINKVFAVTLTLYTQFMVLLPR